MHRPNRGADPGFVPSSGLGRARRGGRAESDEKREAAARAVAARCRQCRPNIATARPADVDTADPCRLQKIRREARCVRRRGSCHLWALDRSRLFPAASTSSAPPVGARRHQDRDLGIDTGREGRGAASTRSGANERQARGQTTTIISPSGGRIPHSPTQLRTAFRSAESRYLDEGTLAQALRRVVRRLAARSRERFEDRIVRSAHFQPSRRGPVVESAAEGHRLPFMAPVCCTYTR